MISSIPIYQQGDIVVVDFPFTDISQTKKRPALVLSNHIINQTGDYLLVMITSQVKYYGLSLPITSVDYTDSIVSVDQLHQILQHFLPTSLYCIVIQPLRMRFGNRC